MVCEMVRKHTSHGKCCVVALVHLLFLSSCLAQLAWSPIQVDSESKFRTSFGSSYTQTLRISSQASPNYLATVIPQVFFLKTSCVSGQVDLWTRKSVGCACSWKNHLEPDNGHEHAKERNLTHSHHKHGPYLNDTLRTRLIDRIVSLQP